MSSAKILRGANTNPRRGQPHIKRREKPIPGGEHHPPEINPGVCLY